MLRHYKSWDLLKILCTEQFFVKLKYARPEDYSFSGETLNALRVKREILRLYKTPWKILPVQS
jgi:hypothetical protein